MGKGKSHRRNRARRQGFKNHERKRIEQAKRTRLARYREDSKSKHFRSELEDTKTYSAHEVLTTYFNEFLNGLIVLYEERKLTQIYIYGTIRMKRVRFNVVEDVIKEYREYLLQKYDGLTQRHISYEVSTLLTLVAQIAAHNKLHNCLCIQNMIFELVWLP